MCCEPLWDGSDEKLDEEYPKCPCGDCHVDSDGKAVEGCGYSPVVCEKCGFKPCDGSC